MKFPLQITKENFINLNNGNLIQLFNDDNSEIDMEKYKTSQIYKNINKGKEIEVKFFKKLISSYENFIKFMNQDDIIIDYTYLWDIICTPNPKLFPNGINLIILNIENNDITDNVSLICPSMIYSKEPISLSKLSLMLIKSQNYYEPIYLIEDRKKDIKLIKLLSSNIVTNNLKNIITTIKLIIDDNCKSLPSLPGVYKFSKNLSAQRIFNLISSKGYEITKQILNFNGQIIALIVNKDGKEGYIPTAPSGSLSEIEMEFMDADNLWKNYQSTKDFLEEISSVSDDRIKVKPIIKVIEDELIVGLLTNGNQFVAINPPIQDTFGSDLNIIKDNNYIGADIKIQTSEEKDKERIKIIQNIRLESEFFNIFRNQVRITLGEFKNQFKRKDLEKLIKKEDMLYLVKLENISTILKKLIKNVIFSEYSEEVLLNIGNISNCLNKDLCKDKEFCYVTDDDECKLVIPKNNLLNGLDNENIYFIRIADELIRYKRISQFIFEPIAYLSFAKIKYNLNENEILMLQSLITQQYFDKLDIIDTNKYIKNSTYDTAYPNKSKFYSNTISEKSKVLPEKEKEKTMEISEVKEEIVPGKEIKETIVEEKVNQDDIHCEINKKNLVGKWKSMFPSNTIELYFTCDKSICTYELILYIIKDYSEENRNLTKTDLKNELIIIYQNYESIMPYLLQILETQGKGSIIKLVKNGSINMEDLLLSEDYYLTNLDFALIAIHYNIPLIFLSSTVLIENNKSFLIVNSTNNEDYYFVRTPGVRTEGLPVQRLFENNGALISLRSLKPKFKEEIESEKSFSYVNDYLKVFEKKKPKKIKLVIKEKK